MQPKSFDELTREWGSQTKEFLTLLGDMLTQRLKAKLPIIIGGGVYGTLAVIFALFVVTWLSVAGYQALLENDFRPVIASLIVSGGSLVISVFSLLILKFHVLKKQAQSGDDVAELSDAGRDLLELSKDVAKQTLLPKAILKQQAGRIVAASLVFGFLVGMAAEGSAPGEKR